MSDHTSATGKQERFALLLILLFGALFYFGSAWSSLPAWTDQAPSGYYGLQTEAFRAGQLHLKLEPHPQLLRLEDPYDPVANAPYRVHDMSLYRGKYYLYFGVTPILVLMLPWNVLTGTYLTEPFTVAFFGTASLGISLYWLTLVRRRLFPMAGPATTISAGLVLAFGNMVPALMQAPGFYQVPMTCAYFFGFLALTLACRALWSEQRGAWWLAAASFSWGLAVAARPNFLFASILLVGVWWWKLDRSRDLRVWLTRRSLRFGVAAVLPLGLIGVGLMAYNQARFDSITEFGMKYQLASFRIAEQPLMGLGHLLPNLWGYLFSTPQWERYFPFVIPGASQLPLGALAVFPFFWIGAIGLFRLSGRDSTLPKEVRQVADLIVLPLVGILLFLCLYFALILRYATDFIVWLALLSALFALHFDAAAPTATRQRLRRALVVLVAVITVAVNVFYAARMFPQPERLQFVGRWLNAPSHLWAKLTNERYGPVKLTVQFPAGRAGATEPLVATGAFAEESDVVYVRYLSADRIQFGFFHSGLGGPTSAPLTVSRGENAVEVYMGSFAPPEAHPFFGDWSRLAVAGVRRKLEIKLNGETALTAAANFYPSSPGRLAIGRNPNGVGQIEPRFTGQILRQEQLPLEAADYLAPQLKLGEVLRFKLTFPLGRAGTSEPLLQTGSGSRGDLVYVSYLKNNRLRVGLDHWGGGGPVTEAVEYNPELEHTLLLWIGPLASDGDATEAKVSERAVPLPRRYAVSLNGRWLINTEEAFAPSELDDFVIGVNSRRHSSAGPMFSGRITQMDTIPRDVLPPPPRRSGYGDVRLSVVFPRGMSGQVEPLVTTGQTGAGDFIYVRYVDDHHVRIGHDHWGFGGTESEPIAVDYEQPHRLEITMDALRPPEEPRQGVAVVRLDGREVLRARSPNHPAQPDQIVLLQNPIGGSTTSERFTGRVLLLERGEPTPGGP